MGGAPVFGCGRPGCAHGVILLRLMAAADSRIAGPRRQRYHTLGRVPACRDLDAGGLPALPSNSLPRELPLAILSEVAGPTSSEPAARPRVAVVRTRPESVLE